MNLRVELHRPRLEVSRKESRYAKTPVHQPNTNDVEVLGIGRPQKGKEIPKQACQSKEGCDWTSLAGRGRTLFAELVDSSNSGIHRI